MKRLLLITVLAVAMSPVTAANVDVSVSVGHPGFYGRIDIGDYPQPQLIYRQPRYVERYGMDHPPIYMRVPPGHAKNWKKHCSAYNACGERVYFVQDNWYQREYVPRYQERHGERRDERHDDRRDQSRNKDRGNGKSDHGNNGNHGRNR